jgi:hypothetical protein
VLVARLFLWEERSRPALSGAGKLGRRGATWQDVFPVVKPESAGKGGFLSITFAVIGVHRK